MANIHGDLLVVPTPYYPLPQPEDSDRLLSEFDKHRNLQYTPVSSRIWSESDYLVKKSPPSQAHIFGMTPLLWTIVVASITAMIVDVVVGASMGTRLHEVSNHCDKSPLPSSEVIQLVCC
jgi:hypothetical protein